MKQRQVMDLLNIRTGEGKMVFILFGLAVLEFLASALARTSTYALFLAGCDALTLPYAYISVAILATLISYALLRLTDRISLANVLLSNVAFVAAGIGSIKPPISRSQRS
ncbi:MAG: hypothetical protein GY814_17055 [Gammaproteobacteria bacterium]|nr:hypothetical protein [Gammaproteobacteria bacterium]